MDIQMPGMSGIEAIRTIRADNPEVPIGVLTMFETREYVEAALNAGATGYVAKDAMPDEFCDAASALAQGKRTLVAIPRLPDHQPASLRPGTILTRLTERELEVLRALATGAEKEEIARRLGISPKTLRNHISNTYHKLGIFDRAQAVIVAVREGLVEVDQR
jgi:DNA-binding NarL/FixJ family response regulator